MRERAEELGGTCTVTSAVGTGTLVEATLPLAAAPARDPGWLMERLRVLVVDDHEQFRKGLEAMLAATDTVEVIGSVVDGRRRSTSPSSCSPT